MDLEIQKFKCITDLTVRSYEVDFLGVVNNSVYFNYFEMARLDYFLKVLRDDNNENIIKLEDINFFVVHNECDYFFPVRYNEKLQIYTRISYVKKTSFCFEHIVYNETQKKYIATGKGIIVHFDKQTLLPSDIDDVFKNKIGNYDINVQFKKDS